MVDILTDTRLIMSDKERLTLGQYTANIIIYGVSVKNWSDIDQVSVKHRLLVMMLAVCHLSVDYYSADI